MRKSEAKWAAAGLAVSHRDTGMTQFPDAERGIWYSANRTALVEGWVSESMDGAQVSTLMGDYRDPDVGTVRARTLPNFWNHSSCDHGVSTLLLPAGPRKTLARVTWLVHEDAVEGRDYQLGKLMPFWQLTSEQDWAICERQQRGVDSTAYQPGPVLEVQGIQRRRVRAVVRQDADVVIIGGGAIGCSIAYHLARFSKKSVLLLEKAQLTHGSTWHAAGLVGQLRSKRNLTRLMQNSVALYRTLERETGQAIDWHEVGSVRLASSQERWSELKRAATTARGFNFEMELISPEAGSEKISNSYS